MNNGTVYNPWGSLHGMPVVIGNKRSRTDTGYWSQPRQQVAYRGYGGQTKTQLKKRKKRHGKGSTFQEKVRKMEPAKHNTVNDSTNSLAVLHQNIQTYNLTAQIVQGDGNPNRDGDAIYLEALKLNGFYQSSPATGAYQLRLLVGFSGEEYNPASLLPGSLTAGELFLPNTGALWAASSIINPKAFTVLYDTTIVINSLTANAVDLEAFQQTIPIKQKFSYQSSTSIYGKIKNLYVVAIGCIAGGVAATTPAGFVGINTDLIFKPF